MPEFDEEWLPEMQITTSWLEVLIGRGWEIRCLKDQQHLFEFRDPTGISGSDYRVRTFEEPFPKPVVLWLFENVDMVHIG